MPTTTTAPVSTPVLTLASRRSDVLPDPLQRAAAAGRSLADASRLFDVLTAGDDFGGFDALVGDLARSRNADCPGEQECTELLAQLLIDLPESQRAAVGRLASAWGARVTSALEVGFHAGFAAGSATR